MIGLLFVTFLMYRLMIVTEILSATDARWILISVIQTHCGRWVMRNGRCKSMGDEQTFLWQLWPRGEMEMKHPEYDSPLILNVSDIATQMARNIDEMSWQAIQRVGIDVDKDKLLAALKQDAERYREAYANGYDTGYQKRDEEIIRCKDCKHYKYGMCDLFHPHGCAETWFCSDGERREEDDSDNNNG